MDPICARATRRRPPPAVFAMAVTLLVLLAACADSPEAAEDGTAAEPTTTAADSDDPETPAPGGEAGAGSELLAFSAETVGGEPFDGAELAGEPVALWFWAPW